MGFVGIVLFLAFMSGYFLAFWQYRYEKLRNLALRAEIIGMHNRVHPVKPSPRTTCKGKACADPSQTNLDLLN